MMTAVKFLVMISLFLLITLVGLFLLISDQHLPHFIVKD